MRILLFALGGLLVLVTVGAVYLFWRMKHYLGRSEEGVQSTMSDIVEEIDSFQEKTQ